MAWLFLALLPLSLALAAWIIGAILLVRYGARTPESQSFDAIVVAGALVRPDGSPSPALLRRIRTGVQLYHDKLAPKLVFSGGSRFGRPAEAKVCAAVAMNLGVPENALVLELESQSTDENGRFSRALIGDLSIVVVTDTFHLYRCVRVFRRHFSSVEGCGALRPEGTPLRRAMREVTSLVVYVASGKA